MTKLRVGVLRGGPSSEYDISLKTGGAVLQSLSPETYVPYDILIDRDGVWHINGYPTTHEQVSRTTDVVFNGLHGAYGEDGTIQRELDQFGIPYTGSDAFSSMVAMNKHIASKHFTEAGLRTPRSVFIREGDDVATRAMNIFQSMAMPYVVKPAASGSSVGVMMVDRFEALMQAIETALQYSRGVLVEELVKGREITCAVIDGVGGDVYPLSPIEIIVPQGKGVWDYEAKYDGKTQEICPANISSERMAEIQDLAVRAHKALRLRHYSRTDFIMTPKAIYVLETNSLPGLAEESLMPKALKAHDLAFSEFVDHVLELALRRK